MSTSLGQHAEMLVAKHLEADNFIIVARNYRSHAGEIDLIAQNKDLITFVEVKMRTRNFFDLSELITPAKQKKIIKTAQHYITQYKGKPVSFRFDAALVDYQAHELKITYIPDAFRSESL